jgi:sigma-B regulation protein RsbU (phosphoserine phosphatase)
LSIENKQLSDPSPESDPAESLASRIVAEPVTDEFETAHAEVPVEGPSGGDFHAVFPVQDGSGDVAVVLGDISGHGPSQTPQAEHTRDLLADCLDVGLSPAESLDAVNALLEPDPNFHGFGTAFVGLIESGTGKVTYASGGHEPGLIAPQPDKPDDPVEELLTTGPPLGIISTEARHFEEKQATLPEGGTLLLYTDGVSDARPPEDRSRWYGTARLKEDLAKLRHRPPLQIVSDLLQSVINFCRGRFHDDAMLLAIRRRRGRRRL